MEEKYHLQAKSGRPLTEVVTITLVFYLVSYITKYIYDIYGFVSLELKQWDTLEIYFLKTTLLG